MTRVKIAVVGVGKTATHITKTIMDNSEMLKKDVEITLLDTKEFENPEKPRKKAKLLAKEIRDSGRALGKQLHVYSGPDNIPKPDITIITTGRQRKQDESRNDMSKDNSKPLEYFITKYCPDNNILLEDSILGNLVNSVGGLSPYALELMKKAYGKKANPKKIFSFGTGLDWLRTEGTIYDYIGNNPVLRKKSGCDVVFKGVCGGHDDTMVHAMDCSTIGGEQIRYVLGERNVANICEDVRGMGAEYNKTLEGAGPSVGADVFRNLIMPVVNNSLENVPILAPLKISNDSDLHSLDLDREIILDYISEKARNSNIFKPEEFEEMPLEYVWTGLYPKVGREGMVELGVPELSYNEKCQFEKSIASTIYENLEGGILRPYLDVKIKRPVLASA